MRNLTYQEAIEENEMISLAVALRELKSHCANYQEFFDDCGLFQTYTTQTLLFWLGY